MTDRDAPQGPTARSSSFDPAVARAFGLVVRRQRNQRGIAQEDLANIATVDRSFFGKLERGERQPSLGTLLRIAKALATSGSELVGQVEAELAPPGNQRVENQRVGSQRTASQ